MQGENVQQHFEFPPEWDAAAIDPRLFSQTSELAGALTLPPNSHHPISSALYARSDHPPQRSPQQERPSTSTPSTSPAPPPAPGAPEIHPVLAEVLKAVPNFNLSTRITSGPTVSAPASSVDGPLPPRFCSIKGCKTLIPGNSFFKMCEPCRDRYRSYGTTKRAKWKREKEVVVAELHKRRTEEDARRAAEGLPPLPPEEDNWHEYSPPQGEDGAGSVAGPSSSSSTPGVTENGEPAPLPPRMCTVSHCREILPGDYQFLRCERHRIQNRHHSKLKRVRDKEVKAQVHDGWAAAVGATANTPEVEETDDEVGMPDVSLSANDIAQVFEGLEKDFADAGLAPEFAGVVADAAAPPHPIVEDTPLGEPSTGLPPAARGQRRTNHVCSIKSCANLLSPSNPWKMCDLCRTRDRAGRRLKALRDSGLIPPEVAAGKIVEVKMEVEGRERSAGERKEKGKKKAKGKAASAAPPPAIQQPDSNIASGSGTVPASEVAQPSESSGNALVDGAAEPTTALEPTAMHQVPADGGSETHTAMFNGESAVDHPNLVFMEPVLGDLASTLVHHLSQVIL